MVWPGRQMYLDKRVNHCDFQGVAGLDVNAGVEAPLPVSRGFGDGMELEFT